MLFVVGKSNVNRPYGQQYTGVLMNKKQIIQNAFSMPLYSPSYPPGPYRFINREYLIITYETDMSLLRETVPEPLEVSKPIVKFEFIRMPDSSGFGSYTESGQVIPVKFKGKQGIYIQSMFLNDYAPIAAGREIWGFPKKLANPELKIQKEALVGKLEYGGCCIATATMGYKYAEVSKSKILKSMQEPNYLLKIIPHANGSLQICELVEYQLKNITIKGAWSGPGTLELVPHATASVASLPVQKVISAEHFLSDLTLPYGKVVYNYIS